LFCFGAAQDEAKCLRLLVWVWAGPVSYEVFGYSDSLSETKNCRMEASQGNNPNCLSSWKCKLLSLGGRLILINSVLTNMVLHMISFFLLPKGVLHKLNYYWSRFFWQWDSKNKKVSTGKMECGLLSQRPGGLVFMTLRSKYDSTG
jgi:hypothetical protein